MTIKLCPKEGKKFLLLGSIDKITPKKNMVLIQKSLKFVFFTHFFKILPSQQGNLTP